MATASDMSLVSLCSAAAKATLRTALGYVNERAIVSFKTLASGKNQMVIIASAGSSTRHTRLDMINSLSVISPLSLQSPSWMPIIIMDNGTVVSPIEDRKSMAGAGILRPENKTNTEQIETIVTTFLNGLIIVSLLISFISAITKVHLNHAAYKKI